jgi:hypothetical protein
MSFCRKRSEGSRSAPLRIKLREGFSPAHFHGNAGFIVGRRGDLLRMTVLTGFSAVCEPGRGGRLNFRKSGVTHAAPAGG